MNRTLMYAAISGFLAVGFGAFGAHGIKPHIPADQYEVFQTGVLYHFIHTLVLLILALIIPKDNTSSIIWAKRLFFTGIILFSGSLYLLSTRELTDLDGIVYLGPVTPIGGICFLGGWILLAWHGKTLHRT